MIRFSIFSASLAVAMGLALPASAATFQFTATLDGASERPNPVTTPATGTAMVTLDDVADTLSWTITYEDLTSAINNAHFHGPADVDGAAPPVITIPFADAGGTLTGTANISVEDQGELLAGQWYVNIHTINNPGGEIRGQLMLQQADAGPDGDTPDATPDADTEDASPDAPPGDAGDAGPDAGGTGGGGTGGGGTGGGGTGGTGTTGSGGTGTTGSGGTGTTGSGGTGTGARGGTAGRGGTGAAPGAPPGDDDDGCGCRTVGGSGTAAGLVGLALAGLMFSARRMRREKRR